MFGGGWKLKIKPATQEKARVAAEILGCSIDEFVEKAIETESQKVLAKTGSKQVSEKEIEEIANSMKGLGYIE